MRQIIIDFGTFNLFGSSFALRVYGYGLMLVLGFLFGIGLAQWRARRMGENPDIIARCGLLAVVGGILGARIAFVIQHWDEQFANAPNPLLEIVNITSGGLIYYGGLILATLMVLVYLWAKRMPVRRYLDIWAVSIMVGLAFGRAGCLLNGCCYGADCRADFPLAMTFPMYSKPLLKLDRTPGPFSYSTDSPSPVYAEQFAKDKVHPNPRLLNAPMTSVGGESEPISRPALVVPRQMSAEQLALAGHEHSNPVKPSQALGIANALVLAGLLAFFFRLRTREGQVFALLMILYPITRFVEELIRDDNAHDLASGILTHNQYTSMILLTLGIVLWVILRMLPVSTGPTWSQRLAEAGAFKAAGGIQGPQTRNAAFGDPRRKVKRH